MVSTIPADGATGAAGTEPENLGPKVNISCWILTALSAVFLALRMYCKFKTHRGIWWDDVILIISWITLIVSVALVSVSVTLGAGKHVVDVNPANFPMLGLIGNISGTFSILAAVLSKTSFAVTLLRVTDGYTKMLVWCAIGIMNVTMGLAVIFSWVKCNPVVKIWQPATPGTCWDPHASVSYAIFASAISAALDFALSFLPWKIVWALQMQKKEKLGVAFAMSMGIFAGATAIIKCTTLPKLSSGDFTYHGSSLSIWATAEPATTIMAACIPILRILVRQVRSSAGETDPTGGRTKGTGALTTISGGIRLKSRAQHDDEDTGSDKSILERQFAAGNQIIQTDEYRVEFQDPHHRDSSGHSEARAYERTSTAATAKV